MSKVKRCTVVNAVDRIPFYTTYNVMWPTDKFGLGITVDSFSLKVTHHQSLVTKNEV